MAKAEVVVVDILINGYLAVKGLPSISKQSKKVHLSSYKYLVYILLVEMAAAMDCARTNKNL